ncbi:MAG: Rrf2 family transcriptional regulator [Capnocytophaga sp.]|nr:Rrf2 family transcriptional regulator [Capnocytophaga sp.]
MNNTRFATAVHIMTVLASKADQWLSSDYIAGSIQINAAMVRKEIAVLLKAGLVESRKGKEGGCRLAKNPEKIYLSEIFKAVNANAILGKKNKKTNPKCPIGKQINQHLDDLFDEIDANVLEMLSSKSVADFLRKF